MKVQVSNTNTPNWRDITVKSQVPTDLKCLEILAKNLWWSWNNEAINLFKSIDKDLWKSIVSGNKFKGFSIEGSFEYDYVDAKFQSDLDTSFDAWVDSLID